MNFSQNIVFTQINDLGGIPYHIIYKYSVSIKKTLLIIYESTIHATMREIQSSMVIFLCAVKTQVYNNNSSQGSFLIQEVSQCGVGQEQSTLPVRGGDVLQRPVYRSPVLELFWQTAQTATSRPTYRGHHLTG